MNPCCLCASISRSLGNADDDGIVNNIDVLDLSQALSNSGACAAAYPGVDPDVVLDMNCDRVFNNLDIGAFETALGF